VKYLFDVNVMLAWYHAGHFNQRLHAWRATRLSDTLYSCAITDLGFIRVSMSRYNHSLQMAASALAFVKRDVTGYLDTLPPPNLARWVLSHGQTTDAYLCQLATAHGMKLATFDTAITDKAALIIP